MARRKKAEPTTPTATRKQILRERKDAHSRQLVLSILLPILGFVVLVVGWGAFQELYRKPRTPVARVDGRLITGREFGPRLQFERYQLLSTLETFASMASIEGGSGDFFGQFAAQARDRLPQQTLDKLIDEEIVRQEAERRGISVTDDEVMLRIYSELRPPTPTAVVTDTATITTTATPDPDGPRRATSEAERAYQNVVRNSILQVTGITESDYQRIVRAQVLADRLKEALGDEIVTEGQQVDAEYLLFTAAETAERAAERLSAGATWAEVVAEFGPPSEEPVDDEVEADPPALPTEAAEAPADGQESAPVDDTAAAETDVEPTATLVADTEPTAAVTAEEVTAADAESVEQESTDAPEETPSPTPMPTATPNPFAFELGETRWYSRDALKERHGLSDTEATAVLGLAAGEVSEAMDGSRGTYIFYVHAAEASRELDPTELTSKKEAALDRWLETKRLELGALIERYPTEGATPAEPDWFVQSYNNLVGRLAPAQSPLQIATLAPESAPPVGEEGGPPESPPDTGQPSDGGQGEDTP